MNVVPEAKLARLLSAFSEGRSLNRTALEANVTTPTANTWIRRLGHAALQLLASHGERLRPEHLGLHAYVQRTGDVVWLVTDLDTGAVLTVDMAPGGPPALALCLQRVRARFPSPRVVHCPRASAQPLAREAFPGARLLTSPNPPEACPRGYDPVLDAGDLLLPARPYTSVAPLALRAYLHNTLGDAQTAKGMAPAVLAGLLPAAQTAEESLRQLRAHVARDPARRTAQTRTHLLFGPAPGLPARIQVLPRVRLLAELWLRLFYAVAAETAHPYLPPAFSTDYFVEDDEDLSALLTWERGPCTLTMYFTPDGYAVANTQYGPEDSCDVDSTDAETPEQMREFWLWLHAGCSERSYEGRVKAEQQDHADHAAHACPSRPRTSTALM